MPSPQTTLQLLWLTTQLPPSTLTRISLPNSGELLPTSFHLTTAAQASIGACIAIATEILRVRRAEEEGVRVVVEGRDAVAEFRTERLSRCGGELGKLWDPLAGQYPAAASLESAGGLSSAWVRPHLNFRHHRDGLLHYLGLPIDGTTTKEMLASKLRTLPAHETADELSEKGLCMTSLRGFTDWDLHEQGQVASDKGGGPIPIYKLNDRPPKPFPKVASDERSRPLQGIKVLDLTRVIAGPTAGRALATYGADVLWINAPHNPKLPGLDFDTSRNKRSIQLDLRPSNPCDRAKFETLLKSADVLLQSYRPNALASLGYPLEKCLEINPDLVYASLSAWGEEGPWKERKAFDSLVQFAVGFNEAEGRAWEGFQSGVEVEEGKAKEPRALPCQALDHASGYLLAFGIQAALYHRSLSGGAYYVESSLLSTSTWIRGLGRAPLKSFANIPESFEDLDHRGRIGRAVGFEGKEVESVRHSPRWEGELEFREEGGPRDYDDDEAKWVD
ncbi:BQ2448_6353 [Microbotryum intermedium]|uniref:BQ2448_6353 protein n=1 Tax=Microbotryum intermedium TaxID=269621 RepID=A0A238FPI9_9BASI|nr:BQ2448_6353 [Microbotryum intermedium]